MQTIEKTANDPRYIQTTGASTKCWWHNFNKDFWRI